MSLQVHRFVQHAEHLDNVAVHADAKDHEVSSPAAPTGYVQRTKPWRDLIAAARAHDIGAGCQCLDRQAQRAAIHPRLPSTEMVRGPANDLLDIRLRRAREANPPNACGALSPLARCADGLLCHAGQMTPHGTGGVERDVTPAFGVGDTEAYCLAQRL